MRNILTAVDEFVKEMTKKGYTGSFKTNGGYPDTLKESMLKFMEQSLMGKESGLKDGISLFTYLDWKGPEEENITAWFLARLQTDRFTVRMISLTLADQYGNKNQVDFDITEKPIPTKKEAIAMISSSELKLKRKRRLKL